MDQKKLEPKRRFEEFDGEWEEHELEDIFKIIRNAFVGTATPYYVDSGYFYLQSNNVKDGKINRETEVFINDEFYQKQKDKLLKTGDLVMVQSGHVGHTAVIDEELDGTAAHALILFQEYKVLTDSYFLNNQFQTREVKQRLESITTGNTIKHILASDMKRFSVHTTTIKEQQKIGQFFKLLDKRIANQERKIAKVKALKSAYLTEMFPQEGETVPNRRFKRFDGEWDEIELGSALSYEQPTDYIVKEENYDDSFKTPVLTAGQSFILGYTEETHGIKKAHQENPLIIFDDFTTSSHLVTFSFKVKSSALKILIPDTRRYDSYFIYKALKNIKYIRQNHERHWISIFSKFNIRIPGLYEQQKIGQFFKNLDDQIRTEQRKLEKLKAMKEAYLEEMFV